MAKTPTRAPTTLPATRTDVRALFGDLDDETVVAILAIEPTHAELVEAEAWYTANDVMGEREQPMTGRVGRVLAILETLAPTGRERD